MLRDILFPRCYVDVFPWLKLIERLHEARDVQSLKLVVQRKE